MVPLAELVLGERMSKLRDSWCVRVCVYIRVGLLEYLMSHTPKIAGMPDQAHILAKVKWFQDHPRKNWFRNSIVLSATLSEGDSEALFVPISRIMSRCAF